MSNNPMTKVLEALGPLLGSMSPEDEERVRQQLHKFQDRLSRAVVVGEAGAGLVKYTSNGYGQPVKIEIDDVIFKETDKQLISDLFCAAVRDNITKCQEQASTIESELRRELMFGLRQDYENSEGGGHNHH
jgi:nucleoid-associated protein EbfC